MDIITQQILGVAVMAIPLSLAGALLAYSYRQLLKAVGRKRNSRQKAQKNIGLPDRILRVVIAVVLLVGGVVLGQPILFLVSGFVFYEAVASWCVLYSALGHNTCPMK
jgi:hypothetical protein